MSYRLRDLIDGRQVDGRFITNLCAHVLGFSFITLFTIVVQFHIHVFLLTQFMIYIQQTFNRRLV